MNIVTVVGANGFLGNSLTKALIQRGFNTFTITREYRIINYDTDIFFYLAGSSTPSNQLNVELDIKNLIQLLEKFKNFKTKPLFVLASSAGTIYSPNAKMPCIESSELSPVNEYGKGKLRQEEIVMKANWVEPLILRLSNIYGPNQKAKKGFGVIANWAEKISNNEPVEIIGNSVRDFLYIDDFIDVALKISRSPKSKYSGCIFNIGSGHRVSINQLHELFIRVLGRKLDFIKKPLRDFDVKYVSLDISLAKKLIGWSPKVDLRTGIKAVLDNVLSKK